MGSFLETLSRLLLILRAVNRFYSCQLLPSFLLLLLQLMSRVGLLCNKLSFVTKSWFTLTPCNMLVFACTEHNNELTIKG